MNPVVRYVAIGDSLTAGVGAEQRDFVAHYGHLTERRLGKSVSLQRFGKSGITSGVLLDLLGSDEEMRAALRDAQLITVTIGGNDLLNAAKLYYASQEQAHLVQALKTYRRNMIGIMRSLIRLKDGDETPYCLRFVSLYNPLFQFEEAVFWVGRFNDQLRRLENAVMRSVNVYDCFVGCELDLLSGDFVHPNDEGYRLMAEKAAEVGYAPVQ